uniref:CX domain-containing protein n=1 Tax=Acrobeloides nanus TaxID=290746 RepID=A0A914EDU1_9BILA
MEIAAQEKSTGILYEGYQNEFKLCIFEDSGIQGRNERYEFRCNADLECCGRVCCTPEDATVPLWLMILFIILALVLLAAILGLLAYLFSKRKPKPKKVYRPDINEYRSIKHADDESAGYNIDKDAHGYGNRAYDQAGAGAGDSSLEDARNINTAQAQRYGRNGVGQRSSLSDEFGRGGYRPIPQPPRFHEHETFEEEFKEEYEIERSVSDSSREML